MAPDRYQDAVLATGLPATMISCSIGRLPVVIRRCVSWPGGWPSETGPPSLGHRQIALTMSTYSHVAPEVSREAAERMARALWQVTGDDHASAHGDGE
jgi:hypothetical protein